MAASTDRHDTHAGNHSLEARRSSATRPFTSSDRCRPPPPPGVAPVVPPPSSPTAADSAPIGGGCRALQ